MPKTTRAPRQYVRTGSTGGTVAKADSTAIGISPDRYHFLSKLAERRNVSRTFLLNEIVDHYIDTVLIGGA